VCVCICRGLRRFIGEDVGLLGHEENVSHEPTGNESMHSYLRINIELN
jgi:hypothetical protein